MSARLLLAAWVLFAAGSASAQARKDVPELGLSVPVPKGWKGEVRPGEGGQPLFSLHPSGNGAAGGLAVTRQPVPPLPAGTTLREAFAQLARELTAGAPVEPVGPAEFFTVEGREVGRQYFRGELDGEPLEFHVALLPGKESWTAVVGGWKVAGAGPLRAGADAVVRGLKVKAAPAKPGPVGCWNEVQRSTGGVGAGYREVTYTFAADGSFTHRSMVSVGVAGMDGLSRGERRGRWTVVGGALQLQPEEGEAYSVPYSLSGGLLVMGNARYVPCGR